MDGFKSLMRSLLHFLIFNSIFIVMAYDYGRDITENRQFGCVWEGGSSHGVICTCDPDAEEMYIKNGSIPSYQTSKIEIRNCKSVRFGAKSVLEMRSLREIYLKDVDSISLEESCLIWYGYRDPNDMQDDVFGVPSLKITIEDSNILQMSSYSFGGRIRSINFNGVTIDNIEAFSFNSLVPMEEIRFKNTLFKSIKPQALKKLTANFLEFDNVTIQLVPSRFISNMSVTKTFLITNCNFDTVRPGAFLINNPQKCEISNTHIGQLDGEAFKLQTRGDVFLRNNHFDTVNDRAFGGIELNKGENIFSPTFVFDSNKINVLSRDSLLVSGDFQVKYSNLQINEQCDCKDIDHKLRDAQYYSEMKCRMKDEFVTVKEFRSRECSLIESYSTTIVIVGVILTLCIIIGTILAVYYRRTYLSKKYGNEKMSKKGNHMSLIVPDGRTYRETEVHVIVERADLLTTDL